MRSAVLVAWLVILATVAVAACTAAEQFGGGTSDRSGFTVDELIAEKEAARGRSEPEEPIFDRLEARLDAWPSPGAFSTSLFWMGLALTMTAVTCLALSARVVIPRWNCGLSSFPSWHLGVAVSVGAGFSLFLLLPAGLFCLAAAYSPDWGR